MVAAGQQGSFQEQVHLLVSLIREPLKRLHPDLDRSGGSGVGLGGFASEGVLRGDKGRFSAATMVGPHHPATDPLAGVVVPGLTSRFPCH
jgi:hypothetical protein